MALGRAFSVAVCGVDGQIVEIEADIASGPPGVHMVGLPDGAPLAVMYKRVRTSAHIFTHPRTSSHLLTPVRKCSHICTHACT